MYLHTHTMQLLRMIVVFLALFSGTYARGAIVSEDKPIDLAYNPEKYCCTFDSYSNNVTCVRDKECSNGSTELFSSQAGSACCSSIKNPTFQAMCRERGEEDCRRARQYCCEDAEVLSMCEHRIGQKIVCTQK